MVDYDKFNSKIYLFLSQQADWKTDADYDGDDKITKAEFMDYLKGDVAKEIWDGENCNANRQNDVINRFWNRFDTVRSGKISGTRLDEYNALNDDEEAALEKSFASYKYFNEFFNNEISKIQSAGISELNTKKVAEQLKSSLKTDLLALFESEVSKGTEFNSVEDVKNVLGDQVRQVEYQTIANISVDLYIEKNVKNLEKKYGYDRENDATLNTLIKNCVSQLTSSSNIDDFAGVFNEAMNVIENYLATALPDKFSGNDEYLKKYGYDFNAEDGLNDLQKAVFKTNLANELPKSEYKDLYKEYPYVFEILSEQLVDTLQYKEYTTDVVALFKEKMGTKVENAISVAKLFNKPESGAGNDAIETKLWAALKEKGFSDELIEYLQGNGATKLDGIKKEAITATVNDEFNDIDDKFDINNAVDYIVEKIVAMQLELEKAMNGADNLSVDESTWNVNISVTTGGTSGTDSTGSTDSPTYDLEASKKSAIATIEEMIKNATEVEVTDGNYQDYVNPQLLTTIETIFGGYNYKAIIDNIAKIEELNRLMEEFLSVYNASWEPVKSTTPTSGTDSSNGVTTTTKTNFNLSKDLKFYQGSLVSFRLNPKFNYKNTNKQADVDSSKVTYESSNPNLVAIGADGTVTICTDNITSQTKVTIKILVDGEVVGTKELKIEIAEKGNLNGINFENLTGSNANYTGYITTQYGDSDKGKVQTVDLATLYKANGCIKLCDFKDDSTARSNAQSTIKGILDRIKIACTSAGADTAALEVAYTKTMNLYNAIIDATDRAGKKKAAEYKVWYEGQDYTYYSNTWHKEKTADGCSLAYNSKGTNNQTGIQWNVSTNSPETHQYYLNVRCLMDIFNSFYKAA